MALYDYTCSCGYEFEASMKISERDNVENLSCPSCNSKGTSTRKVSSAMLAYSVTTPGGYGKISDGFKEVLQRIDKNVPGSKIKETSSYL